MFKLLPFIVNCDSALSQVYDVVSTVSVPNYSTRFSHISYIVHIELFLQRCYAPLNMIGPGALRLVLFVLPLESAVRRAGRGSESSSWRSCSTPTFIG